MIRKKMKFSVFMLCLFFSSVLYSQELFDVKVQVIDKQTEKPLIGAHVCIGQNCAISNSEGFFSIGKIPNKKSTLIVTYIGYKTYIKEVFPSSISKIIRLKPKSSKLEEIIIKGVHKKTALKKNTLTKVAIDKSFLETNRDNSLMKTLELLPGVSTISIGSGQSKPVIRGLGFNRVVVAENGIKHEAQQWGVDHGLEIDQHNAEEIEITKGASSLLYGSDAIAGVVAIKTNIVPKPNTFSGEVSLTNESNNNLLGISAGIKQRFTNWFYKIRATYQDFGDYKVPTDKIYYENYVFDLHKNQLRNTAGFNNNTGISFGYTGDSFFNETIISNVSSKNGFFANAHGLEVRRSTINYDADSRDIDFPFHKVNHFKIINNSKINFDDHTLEIGMGYQNNHREEHSEPTEHGYMPKPSSTNERVFTKNTYSFNVKNRFLSLENHNLIGGLNLEYQQNDIGGWGFLIPAYNRFTAGLFLYDQYKINRKLYAEAGLRYDLGLVNTKSYFEWFKTPIINTDGVTSYKNLQRAKERSITFGSYSASFGISYIREKTSYKINAGKSFRIPLANELASDGVNYHMYRYEQGNSNLNSESSYQIDGEFNFNSKFMDLSINPFVNYFDNYIYLNPSSEYYSTLQKYKYTQSEVFRYGGELLISIKPMKNLLFTTSLEYVESEQLSGSKKGFTLPFSPPFSSVFSAKYTINSEKFFKKTNVFTDFRITTKQSDIVPPEKPTDGYSLLNFGVNTEVFLFSKVHLCKFQFKLNNVLNRKIFNHTSFYRLIEVPEPSRNFLITITQIF